MRANLDELPDIAAIVADTGADIWEVFFLVHVGRGEATGAITARGARAGVPLPVRRLALRLHRAHGRGAVLPPGRRASAGRAVAAPAHARRTPRSAAGSQDRLGPPRRAVRPRTPPRRGTARASCSSRTTVRSTRRASCRWASGSVRDTPLAEIYRDHPVLRQIRAMEFGGRCGRCEYADLCGGLPGAGVRRHRRPARRGLRLRVPARIGRSRATCDSSACRADSSAPQATCRRCVVIR